MAQTNATTPENKLRVLIADDVQETRRSVRLMLAMNSTVTVVATAANGRQAIELAKEHHPDIVVMDISMPEVNGLDAFQEIRRVYPDTGCIIITAQKDILVLNNAMALGAQEYLVKPFTLEEMNAAMDRVARQVAKSRHKLAEADQTHKKSEAYLKKLADEYTKSRRMDDEAMAVFEQLADNPECEMRWLRTLAMLYILREECGKLKILAERLEKQTKPK